jgi:signal transduction histidine kinase
MTGLAACAAVMTVCAAVGLWHHRRGAARVARCAHELRGAVGALRLGLDLALACGSLSGERLGALDLQLCRAAAALEELSGAPGTPDLRLVAVPALLADTVTSMQPLAGRRGADLRLLEIPEAAVVGDRGRLAQALGNLIANAIEHGGRRICVSGRMGEALVRLEVRDDGPGMRRAAGPGGPRRMLPRAIVGRHGHGLAVAGDVAIEHHGRLLSVPSESGAQMVLELPLAPGAAPARALSS